MTFTLVKDTETGSSLTTEEQAILSIDENDVLKANLSGLTTIQTFTVYIRATLSNNSYSDKMLNFHAVQVVETPVVVQTCED